MKISLFVMLIVLLVSSCGGQKSSEVPLAKVSFNLSNLVVGTPQLGGIAVYGLSGDIALGHIIKPNELADIVELPNGYWNFIVIAWDGGVPVTPFSTPPLQLTKL